MIKYIYIWSLLLEPLLYFKVLDNQILGFTGTLSKILQIIFWIILLFNIQKKNQIKFHFYECYKFYYIFIALSILSGLIGYLRGSYDGEYYGQFGSFGDLLFSNKFRPLIEYIIYIYYYIYYLLLPIYIIDEKSLLYYYKWFMILLYACLVIGFVDYISSILGSPILGRHLSDSISVGQRFHGIAGEPRDAFIYLVYSLWIIYIYKVFNYDKTNKIVILIILIAISMTESASGLLGIFFGIIIYIIYGFSFQKRVVLYLTMGLLLSLLLILSSDRILNYIKSGLEIQSLVEFNMKLPYPISDQQNNIYPIFQYIDQTSNYDFIATLIGNGAGAASVVNNRHIDVIQQSNPNSQLVRLIYENGLIGLILYIISFTYPYYKFAFYNRSNNLIVMSFIISLFVVGEVLASRSPVIYIFFGIFISIYKCINIDNEQ